MCVAVLFSCALVLRFGGHTQVKYTQQVWHEKLAKILEEFPRVDDVHPFYADLMNVLYDKARALGANTVSRGRGRSRK
jgi:GTP1/Obg family GTP-binding protein